MKNKLLVFSAAMAASLAMLLPVAPVALVSVGCSSLGGGGTNTSQAVIDATAVLLQGAAQAGAMAAIQQDPKSAQYFQLAADSLSTFLTSTNYTPGAFQQSLMNVAGGGALTNAYVQIGIGTVIDLYQLYYGQYVKGQVNGNAFAGEFLTAIQNGFYLALGKPISMGHKFRVPPPGATHQEAAQPVLPRVIKN